MNKSEFKQMFLILGSLFIATIIAMFAIKWVDGFVARRPEQPSLDLNQDGQIDITDYSIFEGRFAREKTR